MPKQNRIRMVDISEKKPSKRLAQAGVKIFACAKLISKIKAAGLPKGDCIIPAQVAGILAAKNVSGIIPLCHQVNLSHVDVEFNFKKKSIEITSTVVAKYATGVEMEALLACAIAALTVYDMVKALERDVVISDLRLLKKTGGKSGTFVSA